MTSGAVELGNEWATKRREKYYEQEYEKKPRAVEVEGLEPPPPPPEGPAPTWNNNVFTNGGKGRRTQEIEMSSNPMHGEGAKEALKEEKNTRHLDRMLSGGFQGKGHVKKKRGRISTGEVAGKEAGLTPSDRAPPRTLPNAAAGAPVREKQPRLKHTEPESEDYCFEDVESMETQWDDLNV